MQLSYWSVLLVTCACWTSAADLAKGERLPADVVVAADGTGDYATVQGAVSAIPSDNRERTIIEIRNGTYHEKVRIDADRVTLRGESRDGVRIEFDQSRDAFDSDPDELGQAVINIDADDVILENLTVENLFDEIGPHAFTVFGRGTRTINQDADCHSMGADTVSLWNNHDGMYYHANCSLSGSVDLLCPRGWCFARDMKIYERKRGSASIWHDGDSAPEQKFVLRSCQFNGIEGFKLGRRHREAQFYLLDCKFSAAMADAPLWRVTYPDEPERDAPNQWGDRFYYYHCQREGDPQFPWYADNLSDAPDAPEPQDITPAWTFDNRWDPERTDPPEIQRCEREGKFLVLRFSEDVTVRGSPRLKLEDGGTALYTDGSGSNRLRFRAAADAEAAALELADGKIFACLATAQPRLVESQPLK